MDIKSRVFIVQQQFKANPVNLTELIPKFDFTPAKQFGELVILLSPQANPFTPDLIKQELFQKLQTFHGQDYLLLVGNPILMTMAGIVVSKVYQGPINFLQWSGRDRAYISVRM